MRKLFLALLLWGVFSPAWAAEINDLSIHSGPAAPDYTNLPLGLPGYVWWAAAVLGLAGALGLCRRWSPWLEDRLSEPSTYVASSVFVGLTGLFIDSLSLDPDPMGQGFLLAAAVFAFLGLIGKDKGGPLL